MSGQRRVAMVSDDLIFQSRLRAALEPGGVVVETVGGGDPPQVAAIFVDLNREVRPRLELIGQLRLERPGVTIIGFCHHGERDLRQQAMARGADQVVTNGAVPAAALRLIGGGPAEGG